MAQVHALFDNTLQLNFNACLAMWHQYYRAAWTLISYKAVMLYIHKHRYYTHKVCPASSWCNRGGSNHSRSPSSPSNLYRGDKVINAVLYSMGVIAVHVYRMMMLTVARGGSLLLLCDLPLYTCPSCPTISNSSWTDGLQGEKTSS